MQSFRGLREQLVCGSAAPLAPDGKVAYKKSPEIMNEWSQKRLRSKDINMKVCPSGSDPHFRQCEGSAPEPGNQLHPETNQRAGEQRENS